MLFQPHIVVVSPSPLAVVFADRVIIFTFSLQPTKDDDKGIENNVVVVS
jgi:hypothetical protein